MPSLDFKLPSVSSRLVTAEHPREGERTLEGERKQSSFTVDYGIFLDIHFGWDQEGAMQAVAAFRDASLEAAQEEESSCGWMVRLVIGLGFDDLSEADDLNKTIDAIDRIASQYGGMILRNPRLANGEQNRTEDLSREEQFARLAYSVGKYSESADRWRQLLLLGKVDQEVGLLWIGSSELLCRNFVQAEQAFDRCLAVSVDSSRCADAQSGLGWCQLRSGNEEIAEELFLKALSLHVSSQPQYGIACCRAQKNAFQDSIGWLKMAIANTPELKLAIGSEPLFRAMEGDPVFMVLTRMTSWERLWGRWKRIFFPLIRRGDFVDRMQLLELY